MTELVSQQIPTKWQCLRWVPWTCCWCCAIHMSCLVLSCLVFDRSCFSTNTWRKVLVPALGSMDVLLVLCYPHVVCCIVLYRIVLHRIASHRIASYRIVSYRVVSYRIVSYHIVSYRIVSYRIVLYCIVSFNGRSCFSASTGGKVLVSGLGSTDVLLVLAWGNVLSQCITFISYDIIL